MYHDDFLNICGLDIKDSDKPYIVYTYLRQHAAISINHEIRVKKFWLLENCERLPENKFNLMKIPSVLRSAMQLTALPAAALDLLTQNAMQHIAVRNMVLNVNIIGILCIIFQSGNSGNLVGSAY